MLAHHSQAFVSLPVLLEMLLKVADPGQDLGGGHVLLLVISGSNRSRVGINVPKKQIGLSLVEMSRKRISGWTGLLMG
jgi:hypothetical protein